ncbi:MAG: hypothetical protein FWB80_05530 [Defluviitaleaceae bacterium]|nr:hypothetical protein [Defluviitaleaceae bacterium]
MKGHEIITHLTRKEMPDPEAVRAECHTHAAQKSRGRRLIPAVATFAVLLTLSTTVFAFYGGFERFIERTSPPFAEIIEPVMTYAEDQGIRITILGARRFGRNAVAYLSVQDISGQNRLSEVSFVRDIRICDGTDSIFTAWDWGMGFRNFYFDEIYNTIYVQMSIESRRFPNDELNLVVSRIVLEQTVLCEEAWDLEETALEGEWRVSATLEDAIQNGIEEIHMENITLEIHGIQLDISSIVINPISMEIRGSKTYNIHEIRDVYIEAEDMYRKIRNETGEQIWHNHIPVRDYVINHLMRGGSYVRVQTTDDIFDVRGGGGMFGGRWFEASFRFDAPLDLNEVVGVIIFGELFEIN